MFLMPFSGTTLVATSTLELSLRMGVALTLILGVLYGLTRITRSRLAGRGGDRPSIDVAYQRQLTKHTTLSLVSAGDRHLLIASNNQAITLLAEGEDLVAPPPAAEDRSKASIDIRSSASTAKAEPNNPIRALQNLTVRRG